MVRRLNVWFTAGHASVTVVNGAERQTSGSDMPTVLDAMPPADLETLRRFCLAVLHYVEHRDPGTFAADLDRDARPIKFRPMPGTSEADNRGTWTEDDDRDRLEAGH